MPNNFTTILEVKFKAKSYNLICTYLPVHNAIASSKLYSPTSVAIVITL